MIQRKDVPVNDEYSVAVVTEDMPDGWAVVASIKHHSPTGEQIARQVKDASKIPG